ncbi:MAG: exosortase/archaeosortase family protein [Candidatus Omnitrophica bacterium]|nr:exosortase/archaeosortase family protein [Candidatus Omnitrophota bacterium]
MLKKVMWLLVGGLLAYTYYPTFMWMIDRWVARDSYYAHGFLIPLVSLYWVFKKKKKLASCTVQSEPLGLVVLGLGALLQIACSVLRVYFVSALSFVLVVFGTVYFLFGKKIIKEVWFPIAFLFLMVPLPLLVISEVTLRMKFFVSEISTFLLNSMGMKAVREGSYIYTPNAVCLVGDPCSGLRSFLAFLCLGFVFAYGTRLDLWKKAVLVTAGLPLAIISNVFRVFAMALIGEIYGMELAANPIVHDGAGILTFVFALICFLILRQSLERKRV